MSNFLLKQKYHLKYLLCLCFLYRHAVHFQWSVGFSDHIEPGSSAPVHHMPHIERGLRCHVCEMPHSKVMSLLNADCEGIKMLKLAVFLFLKH